jgi:hypothetical protein
MELGIITPQQGIEMFHTGEFPKAEDIAPSQDEFVSQRKNGFYNPIVGGVPTIAPPSGEDAAAPETPQMAGRPEGTTGIPLAEAKVSIKKIQAIAKKIESVRANLEDNLKIECSLAELNDVQKTMLDRLCESIVVSNEINNWENVAVSCVKNFDNINQLNTLPEILNVQAEFELEDDYSAAILYHSQKIK